MDKEEEEARSPLGVRKYLVLLQDSLAIKFAPAGNETRRTPVPGRRASTSNNSAELTTKKLPIFNEIQLRSSEIDHSLHAFYLYKAFRDANLQCYWNDALNETFRNLQYKGYVVPSTILVSGLPKHLSSLRAAWARRLLRTPPGYQIQFVGEIEELMAEPIGQGQFAPLSESLCWAILELTSIGEEAFVDSILRALKEAFPSMEQPPREVVFHTLEVLIKQRKVYQTPHGYFVVTPDTLRFMASTPYGLLQSSAISTGSDYPNLKPATPSWEEEPYLHNTTILPPMERSELEPRLQRHNSLKGFRQRDILGARAHTEPFNERRSSSMRLSKSSSCGRVCEGDDVDEGYKSRHSTLRQLSTLMRVLKLNGTSSNGAISHVGRNSRPRKSIFRKWFRRASSSSVPRSRSDVVYESVQTQTSSNSIEQLVTESANTCGQVPVHNSANSSPSDNVYDEPRPPNLTNLPSTCNFPTYISREQSSRCSTLSSQATSSLGYGSQGYPSLNLSTGSNPPCKCNCSHSPCPYFDSHSPPAPEQEDHDNDSVHSKSNVRSSEFFRRRYPSYNNHYSRIMPQNRKTPSSFTPTGSTTSNKQYESLLTTKENLPSPKPASPNTSTVQQNIKSTTNMELELLLPLGNIMKAALHAKKKALKDEFFKREFHKDPPKEDGDSSEPQDKVPINLENAGVKFKVGDPVTATEVRTTVDNGGVVETHLEKLPVPLQNLKSELQVSLQKNGQPNVQVTKISGNRNNLVKKKIVTISQPEALRV